MLYSFTQYFYHVLSKINIYNVIQYVKLCFICHFLLVSSPISFGKKFVTTSLGDDLLAAVRRFLRWSTAEKKSGEPALTLGNSPKICSSAKREV